MSKTFLKGIYYKPDDNSEDPYYILKNASKNKLNFVIIEYSNSDLFSNNNINKKQFSKISYIQEKIELFEKKHRNIIGMLCFRCRSIIGPIRILLSNTIFNNEILKLNNFYLWCYINEPVLILSKNNYPHIRNKSLQRYFSLFSDNFMKSTDRFVNILDSNITLTPIYTDGGYIYIKNTDASNLFNFEKLKRFIISQIRNGNFYTSNSDNYFFNLNTKNLGTTTSIDIEIQSPYFLYQKLNILNNQNKLIKTQNLYNLKNIHYSLHIKNNANKFIIFKILSKNNLFALTPPIYF